MDEQMDEIKRDFTKRADYIAELQVLYEQAKKDGKTGLALEILERIRKIS